MLEEVLFSHVEIDAQVIWNLVHSSWILQINYNKRKVALITALLSSFVICFTSFVI